MIDELDQAVLLRSVFPSYGPAWEAAIDYGIDVSLLLCNLDCTATERVLGRVQAWRGGDGVIRNGMAELLRRMVAGQVEFVVVGGVAARVHGSAMMTLDLDVVLPFTAMNLARLMVALEGLHPRHRMTVGPSPVLETPEQLASSQPLHLATDSGPLDIYGSMPPVGDYERIASQAEIQTVVDFQVRFIALEDLITVKAHVGRPKDRHVELELRAIRELRAKR